MAKKVKKNTLDNTKKKAEKTGKTAEGKKSKRKIAAAVENPSLVIPALVVLVVIILAYGVAKYDETLIDVDLDHILMLVVSFLTVAFLIIAPIYRNARQLTKPFARILIGVVALLSLAICGFSLYFGVYFGQPVAQGTIDADEAAAKMTSFTAPGTHYRIFLRGSFPPLEQEEEAEKPDDDEEAKKKKKSKKRSFTRSGNYSLQIRKSDGRTVVADYAGSFEQQHTRRKLSKRGRGYLDIMKITSLEPLNLPASGDYQIHVLSLGKELEPKIEYAIYHDRQWPLVTALIGLILTFIIGIIDFLMKPMRTESYFALGTGTAFGFTSYFVMDASPLSPYGSLAIDLLVGAVMGGGIAYIIISFAPKLYTPIARRFKWSLT